MNLISWAARWGISQRALDDLRAQSLPQEIRHGMDETGISETEISVQIRLDAPRYGAILLRNNSGAALNPAGRPIRFGLGNDSKRLNAAWKSSDLIGVAPDGRFLAVECKRPGWSQPENDREHAQLRFMETIVAHGGLACFATCPADVRKYLGVLI